MGKYIVKRVLLAILTVFIICAITFFTMHAVPGGPFNREKALSEAADEAEMFQISQDKNARYVLLVCMKESLTAVQECLRGFGFTATAFTGAELVRMEYGWGYGAAAYAMAATTGYLRVYNKRHWVGDVMTGAGVGILCADAGYWMLPVWKRLFKTDRRDAARREKREHPRTVVAAPFYQTEDRAAGVACNVLF